MGEATHAALGRFQNLLGHPVTAEELEAALAHGLAAMSAAIEKRRFAATDRPRPQRKPARGRHIPAEVKREVRERDGDRCTFVATSGHRCEAASRLEYDHIEPLARGWASTAGNLRLRCRTHNQYEAERAFGAGFMKEKREPARRSVVLNQAAIVAMGTDPLGSSEESPAASPLSQPDDAPTLSAMDVDLTTCLRQLGFRTKDVRKVAAHCEFEPGAALEQRVRAALSFLAPRVRVSGVRALDARA